MKQLNEMPHTVCIQKLLAVADYLYPHATFNYCPMIGSSVSGTNRNQAICKLSWNTPGKSLRNKDTSISGPVIG